jgi:nucleoside-diphosphate kinase
MEKTLIIIKPEGIQYQEDILIELDKHGKRKQTTHIESVPKEKIEKHYDMHRGKPHFEKLVDYFTGKKVIIAVYEGKEIVNKFKEITGPTEPSEGTLRGKYFSDTYENANKENRPLLNGIHRSGSSEEAEYEIKVWNSFLNQG